MNIRPIVFYLFLLNLILTFPCLSQAQTIGDYDVVWRSPSSDASGAMPLGNGELGINLWVEPSGDLLFYLSRTDSWSETGRLLKLGKVRVSLSPNPFAAGSAFTQRLNLQQGTIDVYKRQGLASVDNAALALGARQMKRVFPPAGRFEERTRKEGLHLWYDLYFDERCV